MIEKMKRWMKNKAGVSPIIAIILMVAITVVLAATIYVWVSGMGKTGTGGESLTAVYVKKDTNSVIFQVAGVSSESIPWNETKAQVVYAANGTVKNIVTFNVSTTGGAFVNNNVSNDFIKPGQTFKINAPGPGTYYFQLVYGGNVIWKSSIAYTVGEQQQEGGEGNGGQQDGGGS